MRDVYNNEEVITNHFQPSILLYCGYYSILIYMRL